MTDKPTHLSSGVLLAFSCLTIASGCSAVRSSYVKAGYDPAGAEAIKRIAVLATAGDQQTLAEVLASVTKDRIGLKTNYLVYDARVGDNWNDACTEPHEGVILVTALGPARVSDGELSLDLKTEMFACSDEELVWSAQGDSAEEVADEDLKLLTESYVAELGEEAGRYAVAAFLVLRDLLNTLPNPTLTDDEVMEKIELD